MKQYKKINISVQKDKFIYGDKEVDNYIDIINEYASHGRNLNQILAIPSDEKDTLVNLQIILETENDKLFQGFAY